MVIITVSICRANISIEWKNITVMIIWAHETVWRMSLLLVAALGSVLCWQGDSYISDFSMNVKEGPSLLFSFGWTWVDHIWLCLGLTPGRLRGTMCGVPNIESILIPKRGSAHFSVLSLWLKIPLSFGHFALFMELKLRDYWNFIGGENTWKNSQIIIWSIHCLLVIAL